MRLNKNFRAASCCHSGARWCIKKKSAEIISRTGYEGLDMKPEKIESREGYFFAKGTGAFDSSKAMPLFKHIVDECLKCGHSHLLIDMTGVSGKMEVTALHEMGVEMSAYNLVIKRLAMLSRPDQVQPDKFWQVVTRNRGLNTCVFTELDEAVKWLTVADPVRVPRQQSSDAIEALSE